MRALIRTARAHARAGRIERAAVTLERAVELDPEDPAPWLELAILRLDQGRYETAESLARRALALVGRNPGLEGPAWLVIGHAREGRGDLDGARRARARAAAAP